VHELKIQEDFSEFNSDNVNDEGLQVEDTGELLNQYVDNVETILDKDRIKMELSELMKEAQSMEVA
jgi:hypothetical protein